MSQRAENRRTTETGLAEKLSTAQYSNPQKYKEQSVLTITCLWGQRWPLLLSASQVPINVLLAFLSALSSDPSSFNLIPSLPAEGARMQMEKLGRLSILRTHFYLFVSSFLWRILDIVHRVPVLGSHLSSCET